MASDYDGTEMAVCPFDKAHCVAVARLTFHVNKCRKNHPHIDIKMCPFNARHYIENHRYQDHLLHCSDRAVIDREIMHSSGMEEGENYSGNVSLPRYDSYTTSEENWDEAIASFQWNNVPNHQTSTHARQPQHEPAVLDSQDQAEINRKLEERRQNRQVNTSNSFLSRPADNSVGRNGAGMSITNGNGMSVTRGNGTAHRCGAKYGLPGPVLENSDASGTNSDTDSVGTISSSGVNVGSGAIGRGLPWEPQTAGRSVAPVLAGLGRGVATQGSVPASVSPVPTSVGRGQGSMPASQQQPRKVTQTSAFTLPGIGRGFSAAGRGGAPGSVTRPGQGGR